jgi:hypothetical protein
MQTAAVAAGRVIAVAIPAPTIASGRMLIATATLVTVAAKEAVTAKEARNYLNDDIAGSKCAKLIKERESCGRSGR